MSNVYKDYKAASKYFVDHEEILQKEVNAVEKQKKFLVWVQEFSKKIVVIIFIVYILSTISSLILIYLSYKQGMISGIDTLISETNQTFREVVGGYIIKAAIENAFKIAGNYFIGICDARLNAMREKLNLNTSSNESLESECISFK